VTAHFPPYHKAFSPSVDKISTPTKPMGSGDPNTMYGVPLKYVSLVALTLQNTGAVLIMRE